MNDLITQHLDLWTSAIARKSSAGRGNKSPSPKGEGRGEGNPTNTRNAKYTAYGIKKLRELILELAVRGKLVSQDSNDEPAGVLLEKISAEKERLVKERKIKKQNPLPEINDEEKPFDLPENWKWTKLGNISFINPRNEADDKSIASFVPMSFITTSHTGEHEQEAREWKEIKNGYTHFANGDIGVAKITPCFENSKAVVFSNLSNGIGAGTTELHVARPYGDTLCARYILIFLKSPEFLIVGESKMTGTAGQKRIPKEFFAEHPLPLPPLVEQHRIVAKVDELMALCDQLEQQQTDHIAAHQTLVQTLLDTLTQAADAAEFQQAWSRIADHFDTLFTTESSIDQLKQTLLQLAVMGKLVPQDPDDEPVSELLEKIANEKLELIAEGKIKNQVQSENHETQEPFEVPKSWKWCQLRDLFALVTDGDHQAPPKSISGIPFLVIGNLNTGEIIFDNCNFVPTEYYEKLDWTRRPTKGDILYTVTGSYGIPVPIHTNDSFCVQRHVAILKSTASTPNKYLSLVLGSKFAFNYATNIATGIAQKTVPLTGLRKLPVPLAPLSEQHRIVAKVDELMALCDALKARIAAAQTTQLQIADAIIEQAVA